MTENEVIDEFIQFIIDFIEKPHPNLANLPVCPFAKKARLEGRINFQVFEMTYERIMDLVPTFTENPNQQLLLCIDPRRDGLSTKEVVAMAKELNEELPGMNLMAIGLHPDDPFNIAGFYTRKDPFPSIQLLPLDLGERLSKSLEHTGYYDLWTEDNLQELEVRKKKNENL
jgi:hypothetical protein